MSNLLLSTLAMMGMTFIIGFFVAAIIKIIANWADFLDFYHLHREELVSMRKKEHARHRKGISMLHFQCELLHHKVSGIINSVKSHRRVTA